MPNEDFRAEQAERREHGLKAHHEQRLESATYTAAEVKVLTEAALRLGRKEASEEVATRCEHDTIYDVAARYHFARIARSVAPREMLGGSGQPLRRDATYPVDGELPCPPDATSGRTDPNSTSAMLKSLEGK